MKHSVYQFTERSSWTFLAALLVALSGCSSTPPPPAATPLSLTATAASLTLGSPITLTASVGTSGASGVVTFFDGTSSIQAVILSSTGTASATTNGLGPGAHSLTAQYGGDQTHAASTSSAVAVGVNVTTTATISASPTLAAAGDRVTLTAVISAPIGVPTGTVNFLSAGAVVGSGALVGSSSSAATASAVVTTLPIGANQVTAVYVSGGYFLSSTSAPTTVNIHAALIPTTTSLSVAPSGTVPAGTVETLTATVRQASGTTSPTGTLTFFDGSSVVGTVALTANGVGSLSTKGFAAGVHSITTSYSGDLIYGPSTSAATPLTVTAYTGATYTNPLNVTDPVTGKIYNCPDPAIIKAQTGGADTWYAYCTGDAFNSADTVAGGAFRAHLISILSSTDLINWTYIRDAFAATPAYVAAGELQTPAIKFFNGLYHLYYEAPSVNAAPNGSAIGVGTSATPAGPFIDSGRAVVEQQLGCGGACNRTVYAPEVIADASGQLWITYGGVFGGLSVRKLSADGFSSDPTTEINIAVDNYYQDPFIVFHNGFFYEFATAGSCCSGAFATNSVHVGRSAAITGPYLDAEGNDLNAYSTPATAGAPGGDTVLVMTGNDIAGPGSGSLFTDESGQDYMLYSGVSKKQQYLPGVTGYTARQLMMDAVDWVNGWPVVRNGAQASDFSTPQPVPASQPGMANGYVPPVVVPDQPGTPIAASSDDFNSTTLSSQWTFIHKPQAYTLTGSAYQIPSFQAETTVDPADLPILAEPEPAGNYLLEVKVAFNVPQTGCCNYDFAQAGIMIYNSDTNYLRMDEFAFFDTRQIEFLNQFGPSATSFAPVGTPNFAGNTWFRIARRTGANGSPDTYTSYSSTDGITYLRGPAWTASYGGKAQIGLFSGNTPGFKATFDYVHVTTLTP